ncbi:class I lanthipeptide [Taibaiella koreensis]|uniref:class I lanthipeptide n=1 Tax=Taibaiella koreensis TaxID=1268548 RepID=UPI0019691D32
MKKKHLGKKLHLKKMSIFELAPTHSAVVKGGDIIGTRVETHSWPLPTWTTLITRPRCGVTVDGPGNSLLCTEGSACNRCQG